ncbi:hypothetical protein HPB50_022483 [Hyalomma asiaticum]|uniref:Uncharacterized protein n=1 Tax=Hyalomma asiaticum TaxID=266040 RepID=A0ACB7S550_HYAAI|nr:hypothetical protein HPB50_022483 [Hyalomma asiaticum]
MDNRTINRPFSYLRPNTPIPIRHLGRPIFPSYQYLPEQGYMPAADTPQGPSAAAVRTAETIAHPSHAAIVSNAGAAARPQAVQVPADKPQSTMTSAIRTTPPPKNVVRSFSDSAAGRVAALPKFCARGVSPIGSKSSLTTASRSPSSSSPRARNWDDEDYDDDTGTEGSSEGTAAASDDALRFSGNRKALPTFPEWWKQFNYKELSAQTLILAVVMALIVSFAAMMVIEVLPETRDHHHHHGESRQPSETTGEPGLTSSPTPQGAQGRAAVSVVASIPTRTLATTRKMLTLGDYEDYETKASGDPPVTSSESFDCDTEACRWQIRLVDEKLNVTVNPCVDFYSYVCSSAWEMHGDLPYRAAGKAFLIKEVTRYLLDHMRALTTATAESVGRGEHNFLDHSSLVMSLCHKKTVTDTDWEGIRGLLQVVGLQGWPYAESPVSFQLDEVLMLIDRQLALFPILHELIRRTLTLWKTLPQSKALARNVLQFEAALLEASKPVSIKEARDYKIYTVKNFPSSSAFRIDAYLLHLRGGPNDSVVVLRPSYFKKLPSVIRKSSPQAMLNFLGVRVVTHVAPLLPPASIPQGLLRVGYPSFLHTVDPRTQSCFHLVNRVFPHGFPLDSARDRRQDHRPRPPVGRIAVFSPPPFRGIGSRAVTAPNYDARFDGRSTDLDAAWTRSPESTYAVYLTSSGLASASLVTRADLPSTLYPLLSAELSRALLLSSLDESRWSSWTRDRFDSLRKCLLDRYKSAVRASGISATSDNVDDFAEQIFADNAVVKPLMVAFQRYSHGVPFVPSRAGMKLTAFKLFFINYAAGFCATKGEIAHDRERMRYRFSLPPRLRVNLALLDSKEFRDAFNCPRQSVATTNRCPVWNEGDGGLSDMRRRGLRRI